LRAADHQCRAAGAVRGNLGRQPRHDCWHDHRVIAALLFLVLNLGGIAIIVSLHDRHAELVDEARQLNATMGELVYTLTHQRAGREAVQ
jgi:uncharacterized protein YecE (DUF72 family)